jgi:thiol-disulfide isomerase/thioredoxin
MRFLIFFIFFTTNVLSTEVSPSKNIVLTKNLKEYENLSFFDEKKEKEIWINDYKGKIIILNFWASWCAPCKEEMPSLDKLQADTNLDIKVFPVNVGNDSLEKAKKFFKDTKIQNLNIFFDNSFSLAKKLSLRGVPTSVLFNKEGKEFARVIGVIDFQDRNVTDWLANYN